MVVVNYLCLLSTREKTLMYWRKKKKWSISKIKAGTRGG